MTTTWQAGARAGEYVLDTPLHPVAGGAWWRARHHALVGVEVALLLAEGADLRERLPVLARLQDAVRDGGVLAVRSIDTAHEPPLLALACPEGEWLTERVQRGPCGPAEARRVLAGVCDALATLHGQGLAHGAVEAGAVHLGADGRVRLGLLGCGRRATAPAASAADDLRALGRLAFACSTGCEPAGPVGPADLAALPDWAVRLIRRCQGQDGGYGAVAEARADVDGPVHFLEPTPPAAPVVLPPLPGVAFCGVELPPVRCDRRRRRGRLARLFWFPPRAVAALLAVLAAPAAHLAWIGLVGWGVWHLVAPAAAPRGVQATVTGAGPAGAPAPETEGLLADLRRLIDGGDGGFAPAAARLRQAAAERPEAFGRAVERFGGELLASPPAWVRAFDRLRALQEPAHGQALRELEALCERLASDHEDDAEFLARLDRFRRHHVGEDF